EGRRKLLIDGSSAYPARGVVSVLPRCGLDQWDEVRLRAPIGRPRLRSRLERRASRPRRSRLATVDSEVTKQPVPTVRMRPMPSKTRSCTGGTGPRTMVFVHYSSKYSQTRLPRDRHRFALLVTGRRLHPDDRLLRELGERVRARVAE